MKRSAPTGTPTSRERRPDARLWRASRRSLLKGVCATALSNGLAGTPAFALNSANRDAATFARRVAEYILSVRYEDLDPAVIDRAKEHLIYHVGLAFSGALTDRGRQAVEIARKLGDGRGETTVIGHKLKAPPLESAFANSMFIRALGFDDVLFPSATHPGLLTYPVAFAVGEEYRRSGKELLTAVVTGYEVLGKMVTRQQAGGAPRRPSMPFGPFASTTVAAKLMGLTLGQATNAVGYAADTAMGLKEGNEQQPTHVYGWIARNAITASILAQGGGETAPTILEGKYGYYSTLVGEVPDWEAIVSRFGEDPEILRATQKRYPGTAMNIVPIQLLRGLVEQHDLNAENVEQVEIELPENRRTFEDSISSGPYPSRTQAESSVVFQTAIILMDGDIDFARYDQRNDPEIQGVIQKVRIKLARHDNGRYARIRVSTTDGRTFDVSGDSYIFPSLDGVAWLAKDGEKFVPLKKLERFNAMVQDMESVDDVRAMMKLLTP